MKSNQAGETRQVLERLFEMAGIDQVICVDDQYREFPDDYINELIGILASQEKDSLREVPKNINEFGEILWHEDEEIWKGQLRKAWHDADTDKRRYYDSKINELFPQPSTEERPSNKDREYAQILGSILDQSVGINFKWLSFTDWKNCKNDCLREEVVTRTIFLFDQDLSGEGGSPEEGIRIIKRLLAEDKYKRIKCGLLSHTFEPDDEYSKWKSFAEEHGIDEDRFMLISKQRLTEDKLGFARMLRLTLMNKHCKDFKNSVSKIIEDTFEESKKEIDDLNIYDFEDIVFRSSLKEGIWEPDTLFRLYNLYQHHKARSRAVLDEDLRKCTDEIREICSIPIGNIEKRGELWKIQRREIYEEGDHINSLHMPIESGDIFMKTGSSPGKKFILIAQPCNLMVRVSDPGGKRTYDFHEVVLAEIVDKPNDSGYKLKYFDRESRKDHYVDFRKTHTVLLCILDLCVYNEEGKAQMAIADNCPDTIIPSWKSRYRKLKKMAEKIIKKYKENYRKCQDKEILNLLAPRSSLYKSGLFKADINCQEGKESITYNCQRIGRLCQPRAGAMLTKYAHYISRSAFEHDFAESRSSKETKKQSQ